MPKIKSKKNAPSDKLPKPSIVKIEKTEEDFTLYPLSHFIDDRLELVKQIFGTLKAKTVINLSPEFLKKKKMDEIEEMCLDELMCISTKRLKSVINGSKCPTDTETSGDSEVEHQEEHISLDEISSDSEIEGNSASPDVQQISVLELLELQARARAIRSQLALEPVTKIVVDSNDRDNANSVSYASSKTHKHSQSERKRKQAAKRTVAKKPSTSLPVATVSKQIHSRKEVKN